MRRTLLVAALAALVVATSGCVTRRYEWNAYDGQLYRYYKDPTTAEAFRNSMEAHFKSLEGRNVRPAPGLYAEVGTLYLQRGDAKTASSYYEKEAKAWPESRYLMETLIKNLAKAKPEGEPAK